MNTPGLSYTLRVYSSQKQKETGDAYISHRIRGNEEYVKQETARIKEEQSAANAEYKRQIADDVQVPQKYFKRQKMTGPTPQETLADLPRHDMADPNQPIVIRGTRRLVTDELTRSKLLSIPTEEQIKSQRTPFNLSLSHHTGNTIACIGSSKRGKSTVIMQIYDKYFRDLQYISIMWNANPQAAVYKGHSKLIKALWGNGKRGAEIIKEQKTINVKTNNHYKFLNVFDDVLHASAGSGGSTARLMDNLIMTYRNSRISTVFSIQYSNLIKKSQRANFNHVLLFGMNTDEAVEVMIKTYLQGYLKKIGLVKMPDMINWYKAVTADFGFIYVMPADGIVSIHKIRVGD